MPFSGWMKTMDCVPGLTLRPMRGVRPKVLPLTITVVEGIELMLSVPKAAAAGSAAGLASLGADSLDPDAMEVLKIVL